MFLGVIRHELQVLGASVLLEPWEDAHRNVKRHVFEDLLPAVDLALQLEDVAHTLLDTLLTHRDRSPYCLQRRLLVIQIIDIVFH